MANANSDQCVPSLSLAEIEQFKKSGYLYPLAALSSAEVACLRGAIDEHLRGAVDSDRYELTDPIRIKTLRGDDGSERFEYEDAGDPVLREFPFFFNVWKCDRRFRDVAFKPGFADIACQLLGSDSVLLMEDNVVIKYPHTKRIPWHQDYSYWPLEKPAAVTAWIALDDIDPTNGAMEIAPGTQNLGERLPVAFGQVKSIMSEERPGIPEVPQDPGELGYAIVTYQLSAGQCGFHDAMVWHGSTPNDTDNVRCAYVLRYVVPGTIWLGGKRFPYDDIGCGVGEPLNETHFPRVGSRAYFRREETPRHGM